MAKMLLITDKFAPHTGGTAVIFYNWCRRMSSGQVVVLTCRLPWVPGWREFDAKQRFRIYRVPFINIPKIRMPISWIFLMLAAPFVIVRERIDIIHAGEVMETGITGTVMAHLFRKPYVVHILGCEVEVYSSGKLRNLLIWNLRKANTITAISKYIISKNLLTLGLPESKITLLYPGTDLDSFQAVSDLSRLRAQYCLSGKKVLLTVGRLVERKGNDMVIRAMPKVLEQLPNVVYLIVGIGKEEARLRGLVKELRLEDHVIFAGRVPIEEVPQYYHLCDVFIMPNRVAGKHDFEGFGLVFLEANACGKPVIGGRSGGAVDAIVDDVTGLLVDPTNLDQIADAILRLLADERLAVTMGEEGRRRVKNEFTWDVAVRRIQVLNRSLAELG